MTITGFTFKSYDKKAGVLQFEIKNQDGSPTDLIDATVRLFMYIYQGEEKKEFPIFDNQIITESYMQGVVKYPIPDMLLSYEGKVDANVYIDFPDGSHTDNLAFTFNIEKSVIDDNAQLNGEYYFKDFQQLLDGVKQEATDAVNAALTNVDSTIEKANQQINEFVEGATQAIDQTVDEVTEQLQATQTKIDTVSQNVTSAQNNLKAVEDKMNQTNQQIAAVLTDVNEFRTDIDTLKINKADKTFVDAQLAENTSQMLKSYGLLFDGTDTLATLQSALTDIASKYSSVKFPHKAIFNITNTLYIPAGLTVDFNGAVFTSTNDIDFDSIVIAGSNVHVKNLKIVEAGHAYLSDADGLAISGAANIENVTIENVTTEGFENGIAVKTDTGFLASNINILNCNTSYGASAGLSVSNARNVVITNHNATHNALDGLKISQNTNYIKVSGGCFGYNVNPIDGYADGIDLYAGSPYIIVDGAVCDYNGGAGIHMLSGELNDPLYVGYVGNAEKNIIVVNCITRNNVVSGIDILSKVTVSATTPHPSKILISNSISEGNEYGIIMKARHVTVSGCITTGNKKYGITVAQSRYIILADNHVIANSKLSAGAYPGIYISASAYVQVDKGIINGADSDSLQDGNESALTIWHVHGIEINGADTCDNIFIDTPIITNYTGFRQVNVSNTAANPNKKIIIKLGDIGNDTTDSYYGYYGSVFYKNNRLYEKNTDLSSTAWVPKPIEKFGITDFTATAGQDSLSIPHGLGIAPTKFNAIFRAQSGDKYILYVSADATYLYAKLNSAALAGATFRVHWSASY
ncbi:BppU family phage baseplate upper protein [Enterococcus faecium]